ncbi:MAG: ABC transporter ATP-binding protein [candidate division WS1 bacterium]|nr:ABC transporter ATP-binding protein [candidate division WS1 bacterium]
MRDLWYLRKYLRPYRKVVIVAGITMFLAGALVPEALSRTKAVFDGIFPDTSAMAGIPSIEPGEAAPDQPALEEMTAEQMQRQLLNAAITLFVFLVLAACADGAAVWFAEYVGQHLLFELRKSLFDHLQSLSMSFYDRHRLGELISRVNNDTMVLQRNFGSNLVWLISSPVSVAYGVYKMWEFSPRLTVSLTVILPLVLGITVVLGRRVRMLSRRMQQQLAELTTALHEGLAAIRVIKIFGIQREIAEHFGKENTDLMHTEMKTAFTRAINSPIVGITIGLAMVSIIVLGGREIAAGRMTGGDLMAFILLLQAVSSAVNRVSRLNLSMQQAGAAAGRHRELLEVDERLPVVDDPITLDRIDGRIVFEDVSFSYLGRSPALTNIDLEIQPGEVVAFAGPSGAGKTTIANLIPRLYDPTHGRVLIDGVDVRQMDPQALREHISIVPQETLLFGGTIRENIAYGRRNASEEEIVGAAKAANAHEFILKLPSGYDTQVGERGTQLSGGQRQRVAIARAIVREPSIMILDEATSSLDNESETAIHRALNTVLKDRTAIIIAHRLSTIRDADRIIVLDGGVIVEAGKHDELLARSGLYARLYRAHQTEHTGPAAPWEDPAFDHG